MVPTMFHFLPSPLSPTLIGAVESWVIQAIKKKGDYKNHQPTWYKLPPLSYLMATNELQSGISLCVASHKWLAVKPKCCNDELRSPFSYFPFDPSTKIFMST